MCLLKTLEMTKYNILHIIKPYRLTDGITKRSGDTNGNVECFSCSVDVRCRGRDQVDINWAVKRIEIIT
jgi:hypothetical protein